MRRTCLLPRAKFGRSRLRDSAADDGGVSVAVNAPRLLVRARIHRPLLAVRHRGHAVAGDAERNQIIARCRGATGAKRQIVFAGAALVAIAFNENAHVLIAAQPRGLALKNSARFWREIETVVTKEDAVTDRDAELFG